jgi:SAM-dependent methyltransferase
MKLHYRIAAWLANNIDKLFGSSLKEKGGKYYRYCLKKLSPFRRMIDPLLIKLYYQLGIKKEMHLKLHLGCGWKHLQDYINVDFWITDATDIICNITSLPWPNNSASIIESYHVIEHISHTKIISALTEWHRVLMPGGILILECPHFDIAVREYLEGNESRLINIFGRQRFKGDAHLYGYNPLRLAQSLNKVGFTNIHQKEPQSSQNLDEPTFRIECNKI